jgi:hypothetical protein
MFEPDDIQGEQYQTIDLTQKGKELSGTWQLQLKHMNGEKQQIELKSLSDLLELEQTKTFAGEVLYEKTIMIDSEKYQYINLGDVQGVSELTLNGELIGVKWYGAHIYDISKAIKKGENKLTIKLTTIIGNYVKSLSDNQVAQAWTRHQDFYPMGILGPVTMMKR